MLNTVKSARSNSRSCCVSIVNAGFSLLLGACCSGWDSGVMETWRSTSCATCGSQYKQTCLNVNRTRWKIKTIHHFCIWCKPTCVKKPPKQQPSITPSFSLSPARPGTSWRWRWVRWIQTPQGEAGTLCTAPAATAPRPPPPPAPRTPYTHTVSIFFFPASFMLSCPQKKFDFLPYLPKIMCKRTTHAALCVQR